MTESASLSGHIDILEDKKGSLTIGEVSSPAVAPLFRPDKRAVPNFGMKNSVYWARFSIGNESEQKRWLLELGFPHMDYLDLYVPGAAGSFDRMQAGDMRPMSIRAFRHRNPVFPVVIDGPGTFYLRIDPGGRVVMPLKVWSPEAFARKEHRMGLIDGCYFGAMLVMIAYNFFLFLSLRDRNYLYYILDVLFFTIYVSYLKGFVVYFVSGDRPWINDWFSVLAALVIVTGLIFCRAFLSTRRNVPRIDRVITVWIVLAVLAIPAYFVMEPEAWKRILSVLTPCTSLTAMMAAIICFRRGIHSARFFIAARVFRVLGIFSTVLAMHAILPINLLSVYGLQIGSLLEVLFLSFALADRINMMRREKEEAQAEAVRSSHLAALGELAAGVAHEINTPVNTIINSADLILDNKDRRATEHDVAVIKKEGRRIATIVKSLLFFSRRSEREKIPFAVPPLLQGTLDMIGMKLRKEHVQLTVRTPPELADVLVHPQQIEQVFLNVLSNALHALEERHGEAEGRKTLEIEIFGVAVNNRSFVRIEFRDNGIGIPAFLIDRVKESFMTTKKTGTGLGLSISQQIVAEHGGAIGIESREDEFTRVSIDLPAV